MDLKAMHTISYGLYIIGARNGESINGQTANTVMQISADPVSIAVGINKQNLTHEYILSGGYLTVSVLAKEAPLSLIGRFGFRSGREIDKFSGINYSTTINKLPFLNDYALSYLEAKLAGELDAGTHTIFLAKVTASEIIKDGIPMTYAYYHQVKKGATPAAAPTYMPEKKQANQK